jgi:hypothetical protein
VEENRLRDKSQPEFELLDTGVFDEDRYFDVFVEYAKADIEDILIKITVTNRGPQAANLRVLRDEKGRRPVFGNLEKFQTNPHWRDLLLFHEYFHGDSGSGVGASHQTGWTGVVTKLMQQSGESRERRNSETAVATAPASGSRPREDAPVLT